MGYHKTIDAKDIWQYQERRITDFLVASDNVRAENTSEKTTANTSYVSKGAFTVFKQGEVRVKFKQKISDAAGTCYVAVRKNDSTVQEFTTNSTTYIERSVDVKVEPGDRISFLLKSSDTSYTAYLKDLQICCDVVAKDVEYGVW